MKTQEKQQSRRREQMQRNTDCPNYAEIQGTGKKIGSRKKGKGLGQSKRRGGECRRVSAESAMEEDETSPSLCVQVLRKQADKLTRSLEKIDLQLKELKQRHTEFRSS